jgi:2-dehydro-3-deoxyphosphogalactonate aldolase
MTSPAATAIPYHPHAGLHAAMQACPLIAILRGVQKHEIVAIGEALVDAGFRAIEVPLNSPDPFESIRVLRAAMPKDVMVGAGTVLSVEHVYEVARVGGDLIVMPHSDPAVVRAAKAKGLGSSPGVATPTEAFAALSNGADVLKMFPAEQLGVSVVKAWRAVVPMHVPLVPVGGITPTNMGPFLAAGASGFGLGSALYKPGNTAEEVGANARAFVAGLKTARAEALAK